MARRHYRYARHRCDECGAIYESYYLAENEADLLKIVRDMHERVCTQRQEARQAGQMPYEAGYGDGASAPPPLSYDDEDDGI